MTPRAARLLGAGIVLASLLVVLSGFSAWSTVTLAGGTASSLTGWGTIGGANTAAGENINDVIASLDGSGSYRPALLPSVLAAGGVVAGGWIVVRRSRFAAAGAVAVGLFVGAWGLFRALRPGDVAGLLADGDVSTAAAGPWLTLLAGVAMVGLATVVLTRPPPTVRAPQRTRGIQPRR